MNKTEEALSWLVISNAEFKHLTDHEYELAQMGIEFADRVAAYKRHWPSMFMNKMIDTMVRNK